MVTWSLKSQCFPRRILGKQNSLFPSGPVIKCLLLYLPTQIRFLIGGQRITCHWSRPNDALGRTKLNDTLGKQQLELWAHMWSCCAPWNRGNLCTGRPDVKSHWSRTFLIREGIHYSRKGIYSRKNISCRLTKGKIWTFYFSKLVVWLQKWELAHVCRLARRLWSPGRKVFV